jgi:internalin A
MTRHALAILTAGLLIAADEPKDAAIKKDLELLKGAWVATSYVKDTKPAAEADLKMLKLTIDGDQASFTKGKDVRKSTYKLDPTQKPKALDIVMIDGPDKGKTLLGIYEIKGDEFKICLAVLDKPRPKEFAAKPETILETWKREKPPMAAKPVPPPFPDKNLEAAVREVLHEPQAELNDEKLNNVFILHANSKSIKDLAGLEKCKNLAEIRLADNQIANLASLKELTNLQSIDLAGNKINDVSALKGLTKLQYLELSRNQIAKVDALSGLTALSALYLSNNQIADIAPLAGLTRLSSLSLDHNQVRDLTPLAKVTRISSLVLNDNQVEDIAPLAKQTELSMLLLERNKIKDLAALVAACKADAEGPKRFAPYLRLYLAGNPLSDAAKNEQLPALKGFGVRIES